MPLIKKPERIREKKQIRIRLDEVLMDEINAYSKWADLPSLDYFFEQVVVMFLKKDKEWKSSRGVNKLNQTSDNIKLEENT